MKNQQRKFKKHTYCSVSTGPRSSIGSPMTLIMRPRVPGPTGTLIGEPTSTTFWPRTNRSVESMAIVRTVFWPKTLSKYFAFNEQSKRNHFL